MGSLHTYQSINMIVIDTLFSLHFFFRMGGFIVNTVSVLVFGQDKQVLARKESEPELKLVSHKLIAHFSGNEYLRNMYSESFLHLNEANLACLKILPTFICATIR